MAAMASVASAFRSHDSRRIIHHTWKARNTKVKLDDILIQASSIAEPGNEWRVIHRAAGPIGGQAWIEALSVARRIAREARVDIYRSEAAGSVPTLHESYRQPGR
jgi:hypothetical protein